MRDIGDADRFFAPLPLLLFTPAIYAAAIAAAFDALRLPILC